MGLEDERTKSRERAQRRRDAGTLVPEEALRILCHDLAHHPDSTARDIAMRVGYQKETVHVYLARMREMGHVTVTYEALSGGRRVGRWRVLEGERT
jgi:DNA-binding MarR family transcriptional regulator